MINPYTTPIPDHNLIEPSQDDSPEIITCDGCGCDCTEDGKRWYNTKDIYCLTCYNSEL
jgi:hypothetical protein